MKTPPSEVNTPGERAIPLTRIPHVSFRISERRQILIALDLVVVNGTLLAFLALRSGPIASVRSITGHPVWIVVLSAVWLSLAHTFDAYDLRNLARFQPSVPAVAKAGVLTAVLYLLIPYVTPPLPSSRLAVLSLPALLVGGVLLGRAVYATIVPTATFQRRALIIGTGWTERRVARILRNEGGKSYHVVGFVTGDAGVQAAPETATRAGDERDATDVEDIPLLGDRGAVPDLIRQHGVTTLVVNPTDTLNADLLQLLVGCVEQGLEVSHVTLLYEQLTGRVPVERIGGHWYIAIPTYHLGQGGLGALAKRVTDILWACAGLACLACLLPFIALAVYLDSPGPVFYTQERVGKGGRMFRTYKFRSMIPDAEIDGPLWAQENDARVTRVGRVLRASHLDESPQFLNVLKGEMSMVGPRPERPEFAGRLAAEIPFYRLRHSIRPGMAGWGLIKQGYAASHADALTRLQYDLYYMKHQSLWLDLVIILKTIGHALTLQGRW